MSVCRIFSILSFVKNYYMGGMILRRAGGAAASPQADAAARSAHQRQVFF